MDGHIEQMTNGGSHVNLCAGCGRPIVDQYLLKALDCYWHEDCLKCGCCDCRLGEVGSTLYTRANLILCKRDYLRLFGTTGNCAACSKSIPAFEMVMRAKSNVYHLECFACQQCHQRFCVGDRFYLCDNQILCESDYEERLIFANLSSSTSSITVPISPPPPLPAQHSSIQRRVSDQSAGLGIIHQPSNYGGGFMMTNHHPQGGTTSVSLLEAQLYSGRNHAPASHHHQFKRQFHHQQQQHGGSPIGDAASSSSGYGSPDSAVLIE